KKVAAVEVRRSQPPFFWLFSLTQEQNDSDGEDGSAESEQEPIDDADADANVGTVSKVFLFCFVCCRCCFWVDTFISQRSASHEFGNVAQGKGRLKKRPVPKEKIAVMAKNDAGIDEEEAQDEVVIHGEEYELNDDDNEGDLNSPEKEQSPDQKEKRKKKAM